MHVSVFTKHRDKFATAAGIVFLLLYIIGVQMLSSSMQNVSSEQIMAFLSGGLLDTVTSVFPPAKWASGALVYGGSTGLTNLLLFVAVCAACFVVCYLVAGHLYQRGAAAQEETAALSYLCDEWADLRHHGAVDGGYDDDRHPDSGCGVGNRHERRFHR